ncbi:20411_t:CDS:2 [Rhizophagus irregularis]|nr:20411_t:CDS:2 [Rhizophagus irregularis]
MLTKYELYRSYLEKELYPSRESWARYAISKVFTEGVESTQRVESINGVLKKHLDQGTLLKELVKVIENELDKETQYSRIKEYYGSNPSTVKESDNEQSNDIIERIYDKPQIRLQDLLSDINSDEIQEIWEIYYITVTSSTSTPHYVVILKDSTLFCTCMYIINQGMPCRHQYRVLLQSSKAIFHMGFIHSRWYESIPTEITNYIIVLSCQ